MLYGCVCYLIETQKNTEYAERHGNVLVGRYLDFVCLYHGRVVPVCFLEDKYGRYLMPTSDTSNMNRRLTNTEETSIESGLMQYSMLRQNIRLSALIRRF